MFHTYDYANLFFFKYYLFYL